MSTISKSSPSNKGVQISLYAVRNGNINGIFSRSEDFHEAISGFAGARYAIFSDPDDAIDFMGWKLDCPCSVLKPCNESSKSIFSHTISQSKINETSSVESDSSKSTIDKSTTLDGPYSEEVISMNITHDLQEKDSPTLSSSEDNLRGLPSDSLLQTSLNIPTSRVLSTNADIPIGNMTPKHLHKVSQAERTSDTVQVDQATLMNSQNMPAITSNKRKYWRQQLPGKTAKMYDRHFVQHNYHDFVSVTKDDETKIKPLPSKKTSRGGPRGGVSTPFPVKLHEMLENSTIDGHESIVSWRPHGRAFIIFKPKEFESIIMPKYFKQQSKHTSLQRQLNLYGFTRLSSGSDVGSYYHELFLRGKSFLLKRMVRTKVKGWRIKPASDPSSEPNFYSMPHAPSSSPSIRIVNNQINVMSKNDESQCDDVDGRLQVVNMIRSGQYAPKSVQTVTKHKSMVPNINFDTPLNVNNQVGSRQSSLMLIAEASVLLKDSYRSL